jgi:hypothetical protein
MSALRMLGECRSKHERCYMTRRERLPSRVIYVGSLRYPEAKLHCAQPGETDCYLALSYCWGGDQQLKATTETLDALIVCIAEGNLPRTIQDAIHCTRQLGFKFLWIDALCILQDDIDDKAKEIARMASIYKNATITIAASMAMRAADGFLGHSRIYESPYQFEFLMSGGRTGKVFLAKEYTPSHQLDTRGWALQEFLLSPRMLMYSEYEVLWQCHTAPLQSVVGTGLEYLQPLEGLPFGISAHAPEVGSSVFGSIAEERLYVWMTVVQQYTDRAMSDMDDRAGAIEGVATELAYLWGDRYTFGLWVGMIIQLLAWKPQTRQRTRSSRAPSWSWICLDGGILFEKWFADTSAVFRKESLLTLRSTRTVALQCKLISRAEVSSIDIDGIEEHPDLEKDELAGKKYSYLLLGMVEEDGSDIGIGLIVVREETSEDSFRRIGYVEFCDLGVWDDVEVRGVLLV